MKSLFATLMLTVSLHSVAAPVSPEEATELAGVAASADQVWNARDAAALTNYYHPDATSTIGQVQLSGKPALRAYFDNSFKNVPAGMTHRTVVRRIEKMGELYITDSAVYLEMPDGASGRKTVREFMTLGLMRRAGSGWEFLHVRAVPLTAARG